MSPVKKRILLCLCLVALLVAAAAGTMAYLTDTAQVDNTFTLGKVNITLDEAQVTQDGVMVAAENRVTANRYHLLPGQTYVKDPTVTVLRGSEDAYVRMYLTLSRKAQLDAIFAPEGITVDALFGGYDPADWLLTAVTEDAAANTVTYEFHYQAVVTPTGEDVVLPALFDTFTIPGDLDAEGLATLEGFTVTVTAHAIQAKGFADADAAWAAFERQTAG